MLEADKSLNLNSIEEFMLRIKYSTKKHSRMKDTFFFWIAHAKLLRQMLNKLKTFLAFMPKESKENKARREATLKKIDEDYKARKKRYPREIPKFVKATKIDLEVPTYRLVFGAKNMITESEMTEYLTNE